MTMPDIQYTQATDLKYAWLNFELDLPLSPIVDNRQNPFYVERPDNPILALELALLSPFYQPPKWFFSGHRGCGKSTELRRVVVNPQIKAQYFPVLFSIQEQGDINNIDYRDVLLAIGGQMYLQYQDRLGEQLQGDLVQELENFRTLVEEEVTITPHKYDGSEVNLKISAFFAEIGGKIRVNPQSREVVRHVIEENIGDLINVINKIVDNIRQTTGLWPLILIDDLDKPDIKQCSDIFYKHRETMLRPTCPIVYTVASSLFYSYEFEGIRDRAIYLPNVKLHDRLQPENEVRSGYRTMRDFVLKRMHPSLISDDAIHAAATLSGGVFREMARIMRTSINYARLETHEQVTVNDISMVEADLRSEYRRLLTLEDRELLKDIKARNNLDRPNDLAPLLQILAALEYKNSENWCDVHPSIKLLLEEDDTATLH